MILRIKVSRGEVDEALRLHEERFVTSPGCAPEQLERLARRGARVDESRTGHGLGLAIVADIVHQYGGRLYFSHSQELGGLAVAVELPRFETF